MTRLLCLTLPFVFSIALAEDPKESMLEKLDGIKIPSLHFEGVSFEEALDFLHLRAIGLDPEKDPARRGISFIMSESLHDDPDGFGIGKLDYTAKDVSLGETLKALAEQAGMDVYITSVGIVICHKNEQPFPNSKAREGDIFSKLTGNSVAPPLAKVSEEMTIAANAFLESLTEEQRNQATFAFDEAERENWHFVPKNRLGLPLKDLTEKQLELQRALLMTAMSEKGLIKVDTIIRLEAFLAEIENNPRLRDATKYYTSVFDEPKADGTWGWRFEGHHLSLNFTLQGGEHIAVTPSFFAANRAHVKEGKLAGTRPLGAEEDLARALANALKATGKPVVYTDRAPNDILTGADRKLRQLDPVGVKAGEFTEAQREGLLKLITEYADRHRPELEKDQMEKIQRDFGNLHFGWAGGLEPGEAYYYRIQGADFLIEVSNTQNDANHIHTVWRDRKGDFGRDVLGEHHHHHKH